MKVIKVKDNTWKELARMKTRSPFPPYELDTFDQLIKYLIKKAKHEQWRVRILQKQINELSKKFMKHEERL